MDSQESSPTALAKTKLDKARPGGEGLSWPLPEVCTLLDWFEHASGFGHLVTNCKVISERDGLSEMLFAAPFGVSGLGNFRSEGSLPLGK